MRKTLPYLLHRYAIHLGVGVGLLVVLLVFQMYQRPEFLMMMSQLIWSCF